MHFSVPEHFDCTPLPTVLSSFTSKLTAVLVREVQEQDNSPQHRAGKAVVAAGSLGIVEAGTGAEKRVMGEECMEQGENVLQQAEGTRKGRKNVHHIWEILAQGVNPTNYASACTL